MRQSYKKRAKKTKRTLFFSLSLDVSSLRQGFCLLSDTSYVLGHISIAVLLIIHDRISEEACPLMAKVVFRLALLTPCVHAFVIVLVVAAGDLCYPFLIVEVG